jgi:hypothetical protein
MFRALLTRHAHRRPTAPPPVMADPAVADPDTAQGDDSVLYTRHRHPGRVAFDPRTGLLRVGVHADGTAATWPLYTTDGGTRPGLIVGGEAAEQAAVLRGVAAATYDRAPVQCWQVDPDGELDPDLAARTAVDRDDIVALLDEAAGLVDARAALARDGLPWRASFATPLIVLSIARGRRVLHYTTPHGRRLADVVERMTRQARRVGVCPVIATDDLTMTTVGGAACLREVFAATTNMLLLAGRRPLLRDMLPAATPDPAELPRHDPHGRPLPGLAYQVGNPMPLRLYV